MLTLGEPDYYHILGVNRDASPEEIKQAYHRLATRFHPDLHPDDADAEACLRSLNQAYAILKDPEQRARYDRWGAWGPPIWHRPGTRTAREWMAAVVNHLLIAREHLEAHKPQRGRDLRYTLPITPEECAKGCEARLNVASMRWCPQCLGTVWRRGNHRFPARSVGARVKSDAQAGCCRRFGGVRCARARVWSSPIPASVVPGKVRSNSSAPSPSMFPQGCRDGSRLRIQREGEAGPMGGAGQATCTYTLRVVTASCDMEL